MMKVLTLQRQQRVDRSSQSCPGCLCQTQPIVRAPYSWMKQYYTADLWEEGGTRLRTVGSARMQNGVSVRERVRRMQT